jgi:hypothetical protein
MPRMMRGELLLFVFEAELLIRAEFFVGEGVHVIEDFGKLVFVKWGFSSLKYETDFK